VFPTWPVRFSRSIDSDWPGERKNQLVLIGKNLDHRQIA